MPVGVVADHAGKQLKDMLVASAEQELQDFGVNDDGAVDYPDYAQRLARQISSGNIDHGVAICNTGIGMSIVANKIAGVRAALIWNDNVCQLARTHNDANVMCIGAQTTSVTQVLKWLNIWLTTEFAGQRHARRLEKINQLEKELQT